MRNISASHLLILAAFLPLATGCSSNSQPANAVGTSLSSFSTGGAVTATYSPQNVTPGAAVVITPKGGMPPYQYRVVSGNGQLANNVYVVPSVTMDINTDPSTIQPDLVGILVIDSIGQTTTVQFTDAAALQAQAQQLMLQNPVTYIQVPGASPIQRSCDLEGIQKSGSDVGTLTTYMYCLALGRVATSAEITANTTKYLGIGGTVAGTKVAPLQLLAAVMDTTEFASKYNVSSMSATNLATFVNVMLTLKAPTSAVLSTYVSQIGSGGAVKFEAGMGNYATLFNTITATQDFATANPLISQLQTYYTQHP